MPGGFLRRLASYLTDGFMIMMVTLALMMYVLPLVVDVEQFAKENTDGYLERETEIEEAFVLYSEEVTEVQEKLTNEEITADEYAEEYEVINTTFNEAYPERAEFLMLLVVYYIFTYFMIYNILYGIYVVVQKGQTLGRKFLGIEVVGNTKWYMLILRDVLWKNVLHVIGIWIILMAQSYYLAIFGYIIIFFDLGLLLTTRKAFRDTITQTEVVKAFSIRPKKEVKQEV